MILKPAISTSLLGKEVRNSIEIKEVVQHFSFLSALNQVFSFNLHLNPLEKRNHTKK